MKQRTLVAAVVVGAAALGGSLLVWPPINDVETGRTPQYADLQPRSYTAPPEVVAKAVQATIAKLPRWTYVGAGSGPGGHEVKAIATSQVFRFDDDVTIRIRREAGATRVSVRSHSRIGSADFGQNARNIRTFLTALDQQVPELERKPGGGGFGGAKPPA